MEYSRGSTYYSEERGAWASRFLDHSRSSRQPCEPRLILENDPSAVQSFPATSSRAIGDS